MKIYRVLASLMVLALASGFAVVGGSLDASAQESCSYNDIAYNNICATSDFNRPASVYGPLPGDAQITPTLEDGIVTVTFPAEVQAQLDLDRNVLIEYNPIVFDGKLPANGQVKFPFPRGRDSITVTVTANLTSGALYIHAIPLSRASATTAAKVESVPAATQQVAAAASVPVGGLAVTGLDSGETAQLSLVITGLGFSLLGAAHVMRRRSTN